MTVPQIFLLNQSAKFSHDKSKKKAKAEEGDPNDPVVMNGKRLSQLNSQEQLAYYGKW